MYSLRILFFILPLYFSHAFSPLGVTIWESYSFERYKVYFFLTLLVVAYFEILIRYPHRIWDIFRKYIPYIVALLVIPIASALYFSTFLDLDWLMGSHEKHHGYLFYLGVISLVLLLLGSPRDHLKSYLRWSIYASVIVSLLAIGECMGGIWDIYHRGEMLSAYPGRSVSTLGNPNYVAGYLLLFLPLFSQIRAPERWLALGLWSLAILTTGSYIAIGLTWLYYLYKWLRYMRLRPLASLLLIVSITLFALYITSIYFDPEKLLSLTSRFVLMRESIFLMTKDPISFLIWFGPDSILTHFSLDRSILVNSYFPSSMSIDSSHNMFIDILFQYGILPILMIGHALVTIWRNKIEELQIAILLGGIFLALNVLVVTHIVVFAILVVSYASNKRA